MHVKEDQYGYDSDIWVPLAFYEAQEREKIIEVLHDKVLAIYKNMEVLK